MKIGLMGKVLVIISAVIFLQVTCDRKPANDSTSVYSSSSTASVPDNSEYTLIWSDEFDGTSLDTSYWNYETGYGWNDTGWGNGEWQNYTSSSDNVRVQDGSLVITALCPTGIPGERDGSITSARITTQGKFSFKYGKIEARIKAPYSTGMWPAFWLLGDSISTVGWPSCGEIDILEMMGSDYTATAAMHWSTGSGGHTYTSGSMTFPDRLNSAFRVYEVEWDDQGIVWRIDDEVVMSRSTLLVDQTEFHQSFFIILNLAVGGNVPDPDNTTVWPQHMYVDWVRVYQKQ